MAIQLFVPEQVLAEIQLRENSLSCQLINYSSDAELYDFNFMRSRYSMQQFSGLKIGKINIIKLPVFNLFDPRENNDIYRFINKIHTPTKHSVIRRQLLFNQGETLNPRVLAETERILRDNSFLSDAIVLPYQLCADSVDLLVVVRDLWSLLPKLYWSRKGGNNEFGFNLEDKNILGTGDEFFVGYINERERDTKSVGYKSKNLSGSRFNLDAVYSDSTDGVDKKLQVMRPFYALDSSWSLGISMEQNSYEESLEAFGQDITRFNHGDNKYQIFAGYSAGLVQDFCQRYSFGLSRTEDIFEPVNNTSAIPDNRIISYPWVKYSLLEDEFSIYQNLNVLYRTEDVQTGKNISALLGYADESFDSNLSQWVFTFSYNDSPVTLNKHLLNTNLKIDGFWDRDSRDFINTVSSIDVSYFWLMSDKQRLFMGLSYDYGDNLALDKLLPLGGDEGLRGYPSEYLLGERRLLVNLEHRYFYDLHFLNLFRFAGVVFVDMGQTMYGEQTVGDNSKLLTSTGLGIRVNSSKSNISRIVHIDLAFPLNNKSELDDFQLRITANATF